MNTDLRWYAASRRKLPGILVGMERHEGPDFLRPEEAMSASVDAVVGYRGGRASIDAVKTPAIVLLDQSRAADLLSWLATYSEESFPVSQYCQVQSIAEWVAIADAGGRPPTNHGLSGVAASLIVGEMLAQAESDLNLAAVPLSWANGCFSMPMALTIGRSGLNDDQVTMVISDRLRACESNPRFARRAVGVRALVPMWSILTRHEAMRGSLSEVCLTVVEAIDKRSGDLLRCTNALHSNSAEQRVRGFDAIADEAMAMAKSGERGRAAAGALIAGAALLVGGTTSHLELLRPSVADIPESLAWFGLMAGFAGPAAWDPPWLRLAKGVERQLTADVTSGISTVRGDLSWLEYEWLSGIASDESVYTGFPKQYLRMIAVEVLPGAPCQFRLMSQVVKQHVTSSSIKPLRSPQARDRDVTPIASPRLPSAEHWRRIHRLASSLVEAIENGEPGAITIEKQPGLFGSESPKPGKPKTTKPRNKSSK